MTAPMYIGIDPGQKGAVAIISGGKVAALFDMPTVSVKRGKTNKEEVSAALLSGHFSSLIPSGSKVAVLERVGAMPGQGVTSCFSFGRAVGVVEGVLAAKGIGVTIVPPQTWQRALRVRDGKDGSLLRATELFPEVADQLVGPRGGKLDGRSDALLMAEYCRQLHEGK